VTAVEDIARVCHEANRALQLAQGDPGIPVAPSWDDFPEGEKAGVTDGVRQALAGRTPQELHESWCAFKLAGGWSYGPVKDAAAREHPCLVPYDALPLDQQVKDHLFHAIVTALSAS
jgi:hypothetical protein